MRVPFSSYKVFTSNYTGKFEEKYFLFMIYGPIYFLVYGIWGTPSPPPTHTHTPLHDPTNEKLSWCCHHRSPHPCPRHQTGKEHKQLRWHKVSRDMTKPSKWLCAQRRLRSAWASAQSDQSSLCASWVAKDPSFLRADSKDSDSSLGAPSLCWFCHVAAQVKQQKRKAKRTALSQQMATRLS